MFGLLVDRRLRPPPPALVDERAVRRVHQADHRMIDMAGKNHPLDDAGGTGVRHLRQLRRWGCGHGLAALVGRHIDPDAAAGLRHRIAPHPDLGHIHILIGGQRGNAGALAVRREPPAVVTALDFLAVEPAIGQRNPSVRADIPQREHRSVRRPPQQQGLPQQGFRLHRPGLERGRGQREIPNIPKKTVLIMHGTDSAIGGRPREEPRRLRHLETGSHPSSAHATQRVTAGSNASRLAVIGSSHRTQYP